VGTGLGTASAPEPGAYRTGQEGGTGFVEVAGLKDSDEGEPCDQVAVALRAPASPQELEALEAGDPPPTELTDALAVVLAGTNAMSYPDPLPAAEAQHFDGGCPFTVPGGSGPALEPGRHPVEPEVGILPGPVEPTFAHGQVDDALVEVAVGTGIETAAPPDDDSLRSGIEGDVGWVEVGYVDATRADGPCDQTVVVVRVPMRPEDVAAGASTLDVETYTDLTMPVGDGLLNAITLDADGSTPPEPTPPQIDGTLDDGSPFEVWEDPGHGLCASLGDVDLGCDDVGPVISPDADPSTPRLGMDGCCTRLWFGYLPEGAVAAVLVDATGERLDVEAALGDGIWALPVPVAHAEDSFDGTDTTVVYVMQDGTEIPAPHVG
jgi:hypothetical protein